MGTTEQPDLKTITSLDPDLMIGTEPIIESFYDDLSRIAPTVSTGFEQTAWKDRLRRVGEVLGRRGRAEERLAEYEERVGEIRRRIDESLGEITVTITRVTGLGFRYLTLGGSFPGTVLTDVGLTRPTDQEPGEVGEPFVEISEENTSVLAADYIFVSVDEGQEEELLKASEHTPLCNIFRRPAYRAHSPVPRRRRGRRKSISTLQTAREGRASSTPKGPASWAAPTTVRSITTG